MKLSLRRAGRTVQEAVRTRLWPLPTTGVALAVVLGFLVPLLDVRVDEHLSGPLGRVIFNGDPGAARTVLDAISSSLITVTSLTFSLTVVTLQLASSQFSPRLLRTFTQDLFVQVTLAVFLATFTFSLTVLRSVRSASEGGTVFVPRISVTLAFLLALASVVSLVLFLAHLTRQIRVETMLRQVHDDAVATIATNLHPVDDDKTPPPRPQPPAHTEIVWASGSGFLTGVEEQRLVRVAADAGAVVSIERQPGAFVVDGTPLGRLWTVGDQRLDADGLQELRESVSATIHLGPERTAAQDVAYGLRQLSDIVNKALSPGVNDPTTAVHGLAQTSAVLSRLAGHRTGTVVLTDDEDRARVVLDRPDLAGLLELAIAQPRAYGASDPQVLARLYELLDDLAWHVRPDHHSAVLDQLRRLDATVAGQDFDAVEVRRLDHLGQQVRATLAAPGAARPSST